LDFGIAKLKTTDEFRRVETRPGSMMGTPAYMAPEQAISADQVDQRADLYSLGVILYEMLCGKRPVDGEEPQEILEHLVRGDVHPLATRNPAIPGNLAALVDHLVAPNPDERPASAELVRGDLAQYADRSSIGFDESGRPSKPVPKTVPPPDGAPPVAARRTTELGRASTEVAPPKTRTASMPAVVEAAPRAPESPTERRRGGVVWLVLVALVSLSAAGLWAYENQSVFSDDIPPPMPTATPVQPALPATTAVPTAENIDEEPPTAAGRHRPVTGPTRPTAPSGATSGAEPRQTPAIPFPPFQIPSTFPIPSGLVPSAFTPFFQNIPGFPEPQKPVAPSTSGSAHLAAHAAFVKPSPLLHPETFDSRFERSCHGARPPNSRPPSSNRCPATTRRSSTRT
jgi:hypothetical protein